MEITTIIGIIIALIIMGFGLRMILKKPADAAPSLDSELQVNADSQQPIIPRHVRHQLQTEPAQRVEPTLGDADLAAVEPNSKIEPQAMTETQLTEPNETAQAKTEAQAVASVDAEPAAKNEVEAKAENLAEQASTETTQTDASTTAAVTAVAHAAASVPESASTEQTQAVVDTEKAETVPAEFSLNSQIEKADIREFEEESSILDAHLHEQQLVDDESALATAESFIALNIFPERRILSGKPLKCCLNTVCALVKCPASTVITKMVPNCCSRCCKLLTMVPTVLIWKPCRMNRLKVWPFSWPCHIAMCKMPLIP